MYIKSIQVRNIKGISQLDFTFLPHSEKHGGWYVITGDNGSGKTVLLKSLAMALVGPHLARVLQPSFQGWLKQGADAGEISIEVIADNDDGVRKGRKFSKPFGAKLAFSIDDGNEPRLTSPKARSKSKGPVNGPWAENTNGWFACGYGPFRRLMGTSPEAQRLMSSKGRLPRFATMFKEDATLAESEQWLRELNYKKLESDPAASALLEDILCVLNDEFLVNGVRVDSVGSDGVRLRHKDGHILGLNDMSEGYRSALAMLMDILRHIFDAYDDLKIEKDTSGFRCMQKGVVLIDEVDAHLHPDWQRIIGFWLTERFPNIQFIVSTHSPIICQAATAIYVMPPPGSKEAPHQLDEQSFVSVIRGKPDEILRSGAFGLRHTRSEMIVKKRQEHASLKAKSRSGALSNSEQKKLNQLSLFVTSNDQSEQ